MGQNTSIFVQFR